MALRRIRRRRRASITSLIDVIFLLLLFFMLASTFSHFSEVELASVQSGPGETSDATGHTLLIGTHSLMLDHDRISREALAARLEALKRPEESPSIAVDVTGEVSTQELIDVLGIMARVPGLQVQVREPA
ncbi:biopolymer transporter ExbD [Henriciella aquimarina]|uniref:biopolymer transporter ExbD n=1 Tax=Henriciella aquimarina TaxID=545261 RepID=UPI000A03F916|nr:biopolymer transporter ExbD [Henriciella aquimarina]